jgi:hypothetical protein
MDLKKPSRTFEDDLFSDQDNELDDESTTDEAPPAYSSLSTEDLPLSPTCSNEKHQSILLEGIEERQAFPSYIKLL